MAAEHPNIRYPAVGLRERFRYDVQLLFFSRLISQKMLHPIFYPTKNALSHIPSYIATYAIDQSIY